MNEQLLDTAETKRQFIAFRCGPQDFAVDIIKVREIRGWTPTTELPHAPDYVCGVINLRGRVLPVIDLRAFLGWEKTEISAKLVIVIVDYDGQLIGLLVDAVSDIVTANASDIQPAPDVVRGHHAHAIDGIVVMDERMVTILALEQLAATTLSQEAA